MMKMKLLSVCLCIGILLPTLPAFADLSVEDLREIRKIVREEIAVSEAQLQVQIDELHTRLDGLQTLIEIQLALVAFIAVFICIPQIIVAMQRKKQREHEEKIEALQAELNELKQRWLVGT